MGGDENEQDASIKEEVEDAVVETKGRKTTGGDGVATADSLSGVMKSDESKDDAEGIEDVKKDKPERRTGRTKRRRRRQTTSTQLGQSEKAMEYRRQTYSKENYDPKDYYGPRMGDTLPINWREIHSANIMFMPAPNAMYKATDLLKEDPSSKSKTTSSLFQRDSTERKKSTVVMMQSSPPPGGGDMGGGNGGGVQVVAIAPTRNDIVNKSTKALVTTQLA